MTQTWLSNVPNRWGGDRYAIHQALWQAFPLQQGEDQPFVFRVETDAVLVRSQTRPFWEDSRVRLTREAPVSDEVHHLNLHLNVHRRKSGENRPVRDEDVRPFIERVLSDMGVEVVEDLNWTPFMVRTRERVPAYPVRVDARVRAVDHTKLASRMISGVGRLKYLGFGMIILS